MIRKYVAYLRGFLFDLLNSRKWHKSYIDVSASISGKGWSAQGKVSMNEGSMVKVLAGSLVTRGPLFLNRFSRIVCMKEVFIGSGVLIGESVSILDHNHNYLIGDDGALRFDGYKAKAIYIGENVWVGDKATILGGVRICSNVVIGANSVVTKSIDTPGVYGGIPCKLLKSFYEK